jgi:uncharacterized protein
MLLVTVFRDSEGKIVSLEAEGHTEFAEKGCDVICAGASAVILTAVLGITEVLGVTSGLEQEDGYLYLSVPEGIPEDIDEKIQVVLESALKGLQMIKKHYPEGITLEMENI